MFINRRALQRIAELSLRHFGLKAKMYLVQISSNSSRRLLGLEPKWQATDTTLLTILVSDDHRHQ